MTQAFPQRQAADVQATFCATLVDQWLRMGMRRAVIAPGSRSTPMALALAGRDELQVQVAHDERSAAFIALGVGLATGLPAALLCTSGTAATHFHAAVVEADLSGVPMLVLTPSLKTARRVALLWGAHAVHTKDIGSFEEMIAKGKVESFAASPTPAWPMSTTPTHGAILPRIGGCAPSVPTPALCT